MNTTSISRASAACVHLDHIAMIRHRNLHSVRKAHILWEERLNAQFVLQEAPVHLRHRSLQSASMEHTLLKDPLVVRRVLQERHVHRFSASPSIAMRVITALMEQSSARNAQLIISAAIPQRHRCNAPAGPTVLAVLLLAQTVLLGILA